MADELNIAGAVDFLEFIFGKSPNGIILTRRMHPDAPEGQENDPKYNKASHWTAPSSIAASHIWQEAAGDCNCFFSTCTVKSKESPRKDGHYVECPVLWFDLDSLKKLPIKASDVLSEIIDQRWVSALVRTSEHAIHGYFKLEEPVQLGGKKSEFDKIVKPILHNIAYYYGADLAVCTVGIYMRIPGTFNVKKEYATPFRIREQQFKETYTLASLEKKFPTDPTIVPLPVWFGLASLASEVWEQGMRHQFCIALCGTIRKSGMDRESCREAVRQVFKFMKHEAIDNELETVTSTYEIDLTSPDAKMMTLYGEFASVAKKAETICDWWVKYKQSYCKKVGTPWKPDNYDPKEDPNKPTGMFWEDGNQTLYMARGKEGPYEKVFANFAIRMRGKLYDPISHEDVMVGDIFTAGQKVRLIEMPPEKHNTWAKFSTIKNLPSGIACFDVSMWNEYIGYLAEQNIDRQSKTKVRYYGFVDVAKRPSIVLPGSEHGQYTWLDTGSDTALDPEAYQRKLEDSDKTEYLKGFAEHYLHYHEHRYVIPALGWFCGSIISAFLRHYLDGFPTFMVSGLAGSGKSTLVKEVLVPHFGLRGPYSYGHTSPFALSRMLTTNNILPLVVDEFRDNNEKRGDMIQALIRSLWDSSDRGYGIGGGETRNEKLVGNLFMLGEHNFGDEAVFHRSFAVRLDRHWLDYVTNAEEAVQEKLEQHRLWLEDRKNAGLMGTILLQWAQENIGEIEGIIEKAKSIVEATSPIKNPRKVDGFVCIVSGILLLASVYADLGIPFFLKKKALTNALYSADTQLSDFESYDTDTMRTLFQRTDLQIISFLQRSGNTPEGSVYHFDIEDKDVVHFELNRWHGMISLELRRTNSAALSQYGTFVEMLRDSRKDPKAVVLGFDMSTVFKVNSVAIKVSRVVEKYKVNIDQWKKLEQLMDEAEF